MDLDVRDTEKVTKKYDAPIIIIEIISFFFFFFFSISVSISLDEELNAAAGSKDFFVVLDSHSPFVLVILLF